MFFPLFIHVTDINTGNDGFIDFQTVSRFTDHQDGAAIFTRDAPFKAVLVRQTPAELRAAIQKEQVQQVAAFWQAGDDDAR